MKVTLIIPPAHEPASPDDTEPMAALPEKVMEEVLARQAVLQRTASQTTMRAGDILAALARRSSVVPEETPSEVHARALEQDDIDTEREPR